MKQFYSRLSLIPERSLLKSTSSSFPASSTSFAACGNIRENTRNRDYEEYEEKKEEWWLMEWVTHRRLFNIVKIRETVHTRGWFFYCGNLKERTLEIRKCNGGYEVRRRYLPSSFLCPLMWFCSMYLKYRAWWGDTAVSILRAFKEITVMRRIIMSSNKENIPFFRIIDESHVSNWPS